MSDNNHNDGGRMSDTPRTDEYYGLNVGTGDKRCQRDFARTLDLELAAAIKERDAARDALRGLLTLCVTDYWDSADLSRAIAKARAALEVKT